MSTYSFLSGSSIDNFSRSFLDYFRTGKVYLGFSRGTKDNQWGTLALINVEAQYFNGSTWVSTTSASAMFETPAGSAIGIFHDTKAISGNNTAYIHFNGSATASIKIIEGNESWLLASGLTSTYYQTLTTQYPGDAYIFTNTVTSGLTRRFKILTKSSDNMPVYVTNCDLWTTSGSAVTSGVGATPSLQRTINILGETIVTGLSDTNFPNLSSRTFMTNNTFCLKDATGNIIVDKMSWISTNSSSTYTTTTSLNNATEKFLTFAVTSTNGYTQYLKIVVGANQINEFAIWNENLPFTSSIPVADSNPPALEVSYLKTPLVERSIFDVNGLFNVPATSVKYVKEILSTADYNKYSVLGNSGITVTNLALSGDMVTHYGVTNAPITAGTKVISLGSHNFVQGDIISIPQDPWVLNNHLLNYTITAVDYVAQTISLSSAVSVSDTLQPGLTITSSASPVNAVINFAYTTDFKTALRYGLTNVMLEVSVPISAANVYDSLYRQLFVSYAPSTSAGVECSASSYNVPIYNPTTHTTEIGTLLYVSNRIPIYRKQINATSENFTLIL